MSATVCEIRDLDPGARQRRDRGRTRCAGSTCASRAGRAGRRDGAVRLRQVDAAHPRRRARLARRAGDGARRGHRCSAPWPRDSSPRCAGAAVGYVFQDFNLIPALTAAENVALPRELDGDAPARPRAAALTALDEVGIADLADRFPDDMSGGQQQRVAIARALVGDRRLVLADEPTGALDSETGEAVLRLLRARCDAGAAGVLVTHEARHAAWADRVVFLRDGCRRRDRAREPAPSRCWSGAPSMRRLRAWRPALRIARREALRARGRSASCSR